MLDTSVWVQRSDPTDRMEDQLAAIEQLIEYRKEHRVELAKTDTVDTERTEGVAPSAAAARIAETAEFIEVLGIAVVGHSRWDHAVFGNDDDSDQFGRMFDTLFPNGDRNATDRTSMHNVRDAMHVATTIRYGYDVLVTTDDKLLKRSPVIQSDLNIEILRPTEAVRWVEVRIERERRRATRLLPWQ